MYTYEVIPGLSDSQKVLFALIILALNVAAFITLFWQPPKHKELFSKLPAFFFFLIPVAFIGFYFPQPHVPADNFASFHQAEAEYKDDVRKAAATNIHGVVFEAQQNDNPLSVQRREGSLSVPTLNGILPCVAESEPGKVTVVCSDGRTLAQVAAFNEQATASAVRAFSQHGLEFMETLDSKVATGRPVDISAHWNGKPVLCTAKLTGPNTATAECLNEKIEVSW